MSIMIAGTAALLAVLAAWSLRLLDQVRGEHAALVRSTERLTPLRAVIADLAGATDDTERRRTDQALAATPNP